MNVKGKFRGMTLLTELKKRGSISKIDFEKVSWYLENLDEVDAELARSAKAEAEYTEANERLQRENAELELANKRMAETNKNRFEHIESLEKSRARLVDDLGAYSRQLENMTWSKNLWCAIAFLLAVVSIGLIVKEFVQ